jgi:branched-subunit amino acid transport protein
METKVSLWLTILIAGLLTFATRLSFIFLLERITAPGWFQRSLRFVPAAVLSAIILPELVNRNGVLDVSLRNPQLWSGTLAVFVAWRTKNVLLTLVAGMVALLIFQAFGGHL